MSRVLVTRPQPHAQRFAERLQSHGLSAFIEPMLEIVPLHDSTLASLPQQSAYQAVIATSASALDAVRPHLNTLRHLPLWVPGEATAGTAAQCGFTAIHRGDGDAASMAAKLQAALTPQAGALLYLRGRDTAHDIGHTLAMHGFTVAEAVVYEAVARPCLSTELIEALHRGEIAAASFFSARTASVFATLAQRQLSLETTAGISAYCLSDAVAAQARALPWKALHICAAPTQNAMADALQIGLARENP